MVVLEYARTRLSAICDEIDHLLQGEFPYPDSRDALQELRALFTYKLQRLDQWVTLETNGTPKDSSVVKEQCAHDLDALFDYTPLLGFILRSTNVRNAFEIYGPLRRLARKVLASPDGTESARLIISSEWDYSPLIYTEITDLPGYLMIGFPASESANPLLVPLAGHELGHSVWAKYNMAVEFRSQVDNLVSTQIKVRLADYQDAFQNRSVTAADITDDMFVRDTWLPAVEWALKQCEESFCDFVGVQIFGHSFLRAFAYLLAPKHLGSGSVNYPNMKRRVDNLITAASRYGVPEVPDYRDLFSDLAPADLLRADEFRLSVADQALVDMTDCLMTRAKSVVSSADAAATALRETERILGRFKLVVPAERPRSVADILNAGWTAHGDPAFWREVPEVDKEKQRVLKELILKNFEVFEIERLQEDYKLLKESSNDAEVQ